MAILVTAIETEGGWSCEVTLDQRRYQVAVSRAELDRYGAGGGVEDLVRRSFDFLLQRERPDQILARFRLSEIERYFPEYPQEIRRARPG